MNRTSAFVRRFKLWLPPALVCALNLALLSSYRLVYADRADALEQALRRQGQRLETLDARRRDLEQYKTRIRANRVGIEALYNQRFATEEDRLTKTIAEVKRLAERAGLLPDAISYPEVQIAEFGLVRKGFNFAIEGTYPALRQLMNLLDLSDNFITLEQVTVGEGGIKGSGRLQINLRLGTFFRNETSAGVNPVPAEGALR